MIERGYVEETMITPEEFARIFCDDVGIDANTYGARVAAAMHEQIAEHAGVVNVPILSEEQERDHVETDLRVVITVRRLFFLFVSWRGSREERQSSWT